MVMAGEPHSRGDLEPDMVADGFRKARIFFCNKVAVLGGRPK